MIPLLCVLGVLSGINRKGVKTVSKKLRKLKEYGKANDSFEQVKQRLVKEGIYERQGLEGEITFFNTTRGYGSIKAGSDTYFIHVKAIEGNQYPAIGDKFSFTIGGDGRVNRAYRIDSKGT
jgi:cold shock CspA family protein